MKYSWSASLRTIEHKRGNLHLGGTVKRSLAVAGARITSSSRQKPPPADQICLCPIPNPFKRREATRRSGRKPARIDLGFTLIELIVSISVGAIISGTAGLLLMNAARQRGQVAARCELVDMGSAAMEVMLRYIREIRQDENDPQGATPDLQGNAQVSAAEASQLRFDEYGFRLSGSTLEMTSDDGTSWHPLVRDVAVFDIAYFGWTAGVEAPTQLSPLPLSAANRADIRRIQLDLQLARGSETAHLRTAIYLRSFMNEAANAP